MLATILRMKPFDALAGTHDQYVLGELGQNCLVYALVYADSGETIQLEPGDTKKTFSVQWIDPKSGEDTSDGNMIAAKSGVELKP